MASQSFEDALDREILSLTQELIKYNSRDNFPSTNSQLKSVESKCRTPKVSSSVLFQQLEAVEDEEKAGGGDMSSVHVNDGSQSSWIKIETSDRAIDRRKIDLVLVHNIDVEKKAGPCLIEQRATKREVFENNLRKQGFKIQCFPNSKSLDGKHTFWLLHVPYHLLIIWSERLKVKLPLYDTDPDADSELVKRYSSSSYLCSIYSHLCCCVNPRFDDYGADLPRVQDRRRLAGSFSTLKINSFRDVRGKLHIQDCVRHRVASRLLKSTKHGDGEDDTGVDKLLKDRVYTACYPVHDSNFRKVERYRHVRRYLYENWARWNCWYKFQPLDVVRYYYGENIAMYVAFLGFYVEMLFYPAIASLFVMAFSWYSSGNNYEYLELCDDTDPYYVGDLQTCPKCDASTCKFNNVTSACNSLLVTQFFDNFASNVFAILMCIWPTMVVTLWTRRNNELVYFWDMVENDDLHLTEFEELIKTARLNCVVRCLEWLLVSKNRSYRRLVSMISVMFWMCLVLSSIMAVITYRVVFAKFTEFYDSLEAVNKVDASLNKQLFIGFSSAIINYTLIVVLNAFYDNFSLWLTQLERPRTSKSYMQSYTYKVFCFHFVNRYSYLFYIAFLKPFLQGRPSSHFYFNDYRWEECNESGCMYELSTLLVFFMLMDCAFQLFSNYIWPLRIKIRRWKNSRKTWKSIFSYHSWEQDHDLLIMSELEIHRLVGERVVQFGYVTMFASAHPFASIMALVMHIIELRLTARMLVCHFRRPIARLGSDVKTWFAMIRFISIASVISNAFIIAFTSSSLTKLWYMWYYSEAIIGYKSLQGFSNFTLSQFLIADLLYHNHSAHVAGNYCYYRDFRHPPSNEEQKYQVTIQYWHVLAARFAFVLIMVHFVLLLKFLMHQLIPDKAEKMEKCAGKEALQVDQMLRWSTTINDARNRYVSSSDDEG